MGQSVKYICLQCLFSKVMTKVKHLRLYIYHILKPM